MNKIFKKLMIILSCMAMAFSVAMESNVLDVFANEKLEREKIEKEIQNLFDISKRELCTEINEQHKHIKNKMEQDFDTYTGVIGKEQENWLNKAGILDEEIACLTLDEAKFINETSIEDLYISSNIYKVDNKTGELVEASIDEIEEAYQTAFYSEDDNELYSSAQTMSVSSASDSQTVNGQAVSKTESYVKSWEVGGYIKKTVYARCKKGKYVDGRLTPQVEITFTSLWVTMPQYRDYDVLHIMWDIVEFDYDLCECRVTHKVYKEYEKVSYGTGFYNILDESQEWINVECTKATGDSEELDQIVLQELKKEDYDVPPQIDVNIYDIEAEGGLFVLIPLHNDQYIEKKIRDKYISEIYYYETETTTYTNETILVYLELNIPSDKVDTFKTFKFKAYYYHYYIVDRVDKGDILKILLNFTKGTIEGMCGEYVGVVTTAMDIVADLCVSDFAEYDCKKIIEGGSFQRTCVFSFK